MRQHGVAPLTDLKDNVVPLTRRLPDSRDGLVRDEVERAHDGAVGRRQHRFTVHHARGRTLRQS